MRQVARAQQPTHAHSRAFLQQTRGRSAHSPAPRSAPMSAHAEGEASHTACPTHSPCPCDCHARARPWLTRAAFHDAHPKNHPLADSAPDNTEQSSGNDGPSGLFDPVVPGLTITSHKQKKPPCGTFGCTLPNNHAGLHNLPIDMMSGGRAPRERTKKPRIDDEVLLPPAPARSSAARPPADRRPHDRPDKKAVPTAGPRKASSQSRAPAMRPLVEVHEVCKKVPFCQRAANHPGLCKTPTVCHLLIRCTRPFRHTGACKVLPVLQG